MKAPGPAIPKVSLPSDAEAWTSAVDLESCEVFSNARTKDEPPRVTVMGPNAVILMRASAEKLRDGLHFYLHVLPVGSTSAPLHLALRNRPVKESKMSATAAVLAGFAYFAAEDRSLVSHAWLKKVHAQILRQLELRGLQGLAQVTPGSLRLIRDCMRLVDRAMNRDVDDAMERVKTEFQFLTDHTQEEDIVRLWREITVGKVHSR